MAKEKSKNTSRINLGERGITPGKVAYLYGVSWDTFYHTWMGNSLELTDLLEEIKQEDQIWYRRKWTPKDLEMIFQVFGDPRDYQDIIAPFDK